jgi:hypothetical protein
VRSRREGSQSRGALEDEAQVVEIRDPEVLGDRVLHLDIETPVLGIDCEATGCFRWVGDVTQSLGRGSYGEVRRGWRERERETETERERERERERETERERERKGGRDLGPPP